MRRFLGFSSFECNDVSQETVYAFVGCVLCAPLNLINQREKKRMMKMQEYLHTLLFEITTISWVDAIFEREKWH